MGANGKSGFNISANVRKYLSDRTGVDVYLQDMVAAFPRLTGPQIQAAVNNRRQAGDPITIVVTGQAWRWEPNKPAEKVAEAPKTDVPTDAKGTDDLVMLRRVGTLQDGATVYQDVETGHLWKASRI